MQDISSSSIEMDDGLSLEGVDDKYDESSFYEAAYKCSDDGDLTESASTSETDLHDDVSDNDLIETVTMNYGMGIAHETRVCCPCLHKRADDDLGIDKPTNEYLLTTAFVSFLSFTIFQTAAAYFAKSEAMMGDSAAMAVDAFTYGFNLYAERMKNRADVMVQAEFQHDEEYSLREESSEVDMSHGLTEKETKRRHERSKRKLNLLLELVPPLISVATLIIVTAFILKQSIKTLMIDFSPSEREQSKPNVIVMFFFSSLNLLLDIMNVFCFAKADHALGFNTLDDDEDELIATEKMVEKVNGSKQSELTRMKKDLARIRRKEKEIKGGAYSHLSPMDTESGVIVSDYDYDDDAHANNKDDSGLEMQQTSNQLRIQHPNGCLTYENGNTSINSERDETTDYVVSENGKHTPNGSFDHEELNIEERFVARGEQANLNMCSAYTHVFADTVRSVAVLIAAILAEFIPDVTPEEADAAAAVLVSVIILLALCPLLAGLKSTWFELSAIRKEEIAERDIPGQTISGSDKSIL